MKHILIALSAIFLISCSTQQQSPTPFKTGDEVSIKVIEGCDQLRKEVSDYNSNHPDKRKVADC